MLYSLHKYMHFYYISHFITLVIIIIFPWTAFVCSVESNISTTANALSRSTKQGKVLCYIYTLCLCARLPNHLLVLIPTCYLSVSLNNFLFLSFSFLFFPLIFPYFFFRITSLYLRVFGELSEVHSLK